jgi:hypothetical protein
MAIWSGNKPASNRNATWRRKQARLEEIRAALLEGQRQRASLIAETRRATLDALNLAEQKAASLAQDLLKAENRGRLMRLVAPVGGTVQQLAVHTVGGVVTPAQPLLVIVPGDNPLEVEAFVENKDIGFVQAGQAAEVKIETFPFTRYGTLRGRVIHVSGDAIQDEKRALVYAARVKLEKATLRVDGKTVNLTPGMAVTVEIKTGKRRVVEYFLSPLLQYRDDHAQIGGVVFDAAFPVGLDIDEIDAALAVSPPDLANFAGGGADFHPVFATPQMPVAGLGGDAGLGAGGGGEAGGDDLLGRRGVGGGDPGQDDAQEEEVTSMHGILRE